MSGQQHVCFLFGFFLFSPFVPLSSTIFANGGDGETVRRPGGPALAEARARGRACAWGGAVGFSRTGISREGAKTRNRADYE